jgi:hypothetical protein
LRRKAALPTWLVVIAYVLLACELAMVLAALVIWTILFVAAAGSWPAD